MAVLVAVTVFVSVTVAVFVAVTLMVAVEVQLAARFSRILLYSGSAIGPARGQARACPAIKARMTFENFMFYLNESEVY